MIDLDLRDLGLYRELARRNAPRAKALAGILVPLAGDARELLEFVKSTHPGFTRHNLQHSWIIVERIGQVLPPLALRSLSDVEIFLFIVAAAFHDVGMVSDGDVGPEVARANHHLRSADVMERFLVPRLALLSEYLPRLIENLKFVVESHNMTWSEMADRVQFRSPELILSERVRPSLLAILLRLGDLLDADSDRSPEAQLQCLPGFFKDAASLVHHRRHRNIVSYDVSPNAIRIRVTANSKEEHQLWASWFAYMEQDILNANTYVFTSELAVFRLPAPDLKVERAQGATYETWPLRFEIDPKGKIWALISTSVYTGEWDFVREVIQNAIDANMALIYSGNTVLTGESPRAWVVPGYEPVVAVLYSSRKRRLYILDNGIGMGRDELSKFLFQVAESGYSEIPAHRRFTFPSIARFGIGFVSVLTRADRVTVETMRPSGGGPVTPYRVVINGGARDALVEVASRSAGGTSVSLELKEGFAGNDLVEYLDRTFGYPSCPLVVCDIDSIEDSASVGEDPKARELLQAIQRPMECDPSVLARMNVPSKDSKRRPGRASPRGPKRVRPQVFTVRRSKLQAIPAAPLFIALNGNLRIRGIHRGAGAPVSERGIVWVPVAIDDLDAGVEWRSWHGFIVSQGSIVSEIAGGSNLAPYSEAFVGADVADAIDEYDVETDALDFMDKSAKHRSQPAYAFVDVLTVDGNRFRVAREHDFGTDETLELDELFDSNGLNLAELADDATSVERSRSDELTRQYFDFLRIYSWLSGRVFQDGILVPGVAASDVVPIGVTRARVNLTARSRLVLNINRNEIDRAPGTLRHWFDAVGATIQAAALEAVVGWCKSERVDYDVAKFLEVEEGANSLRVQAAASLRVVARRRGGK